MADSKNQTMDQKESLKRRKDLKEQIVDSRKVIRKSGLKPIPTVDESNVDEWLSIRFEVAGIDADKKAEAVTEVKALEESLKRLEKDHELKIEAFEKENDKEHKKLLSKEVTKARNLVNKAKKKSDGARKKFFRFSQNEFLKYVFSPALTDSICTHNHKTPENKVMTRTVIANHLNPVNGVIGDGNFKQSFNFSGNAADAKFGDWLLAKINIDNNTTSVLDEILENRDGFLVSALKRSGVTDQMMDTLAAVIDGKRGDDLSDYSIDPLSKQFYFGKGKDEALLIPVTSDAMAIEVAQYVNENRVPCRSFSYSVGGKNSVNGGKLCAELSGCYPLLSATPPELSKNTLTSRLSNKGRVYTKRSVPEDVIDVFVSTISMGKFVANKEVRDSEMNTYRWLAETVALPLIEAREIGLGASLNHGESGLVGRYVEGEKLSEEEFDSLAKTALVASTDPHKSIKPFFADKQIRSIVTDLIKEMISC